MTRAGGGAPLLNRLLKTLGSASIRSALVFGFGGVAFALATLLMARFLSPEVFGLLALLLALIQIGLAVGPVGVDLLINRELFPPSGRLARRVLPTAVVTGAMVGLVAVQAYGAPITLALIISLAVAAAAISKVGAAFFQSHHLFNRSLALTQGHNFVLLLAVPLAFRFRDDGLPYILMVVAAAYVLTALLGWLAARQRFGGDDDGRQPSWAEGLYGMGVIIAVLVLAQTERLLIPLLLSLEDMAQFGVLAAVVIAPFRMLQLAVGYTLLPRLRKAENLEASRRILRGEAFIAVLVGLVGGLGVFWLGPIVIDLITDGRYALSSTLFLAAIGIGWIRLTQSILVTTVNSLGDREQLRTLNRLGWASLAVAVSAAWLLSANGLIGILLGVGCGWACQAVVAYFLAGRALSARFCSQPTTR